MASRQALLLYIGRRAGSISAVLHFSVPGNSRSHPYGMASRTALLLYKTIGTPEQGFFFFFLAILGCG
jgi:hypothetical protein